MKYLIPDIYDETLVPPEHLNKILDDLRKYFHRMNFTSININRRRNTKDRYISVICNHNKLFSIPQSLTTYDLYLFKKSIIYMNELERSQIEKLLWLFKEYNLSLRVADDVITFKTGEYIIFSKDMEPGTNYINHTTF